ncbi:MAG TPA: sugar ABC transporter substrate-binding protein [Solirubrobacteraceae bacterium]|nr:sugar ABC transporter substrate-binding protein [Solirubrobacteraceae bacterium]
MRPKVVMTALAVLVVALATVAGANAASTKKETLPGKGVKFGISFPGLNSPGAVGVLEGMKCYSSRVGGTLRTADPGQDINKQISQVTDMLNAGVKAIYITPFSPSVMKTLVPKVKAKKAVIIESNSPTVAMGSVHFFLGQPGKLAAQYFKKSVKGQVHAVVIGGPPIPFAKALENGFTNTAKSLGIDVLEVAHAQAFNTSTGRTIAGDLLTKYPNVNAVFAIESSLGTGAGLAVKARNSDAQVINQGGTPADISAVKSGTLAGTVDTNLAEHGFAAAKMGASLLAKKKTSTTVAIPTTLYSKSNVSKWRSPKARCSALG